jgi:hypothetical protein
MTTQSVSRFQTALVLVVGLGLMGFVPAAMGFGTTGGSGLIHVNEAYSMSIMQPLFSIYSQYFSNDFTPGTSRFLTLIPSATLGLGAGFEGSAALGLEGLTSGLDNGEYDRRFDLRYRDLTTKLRWTGPLGSPSLRVGAQGVFDLPLSGRTRPGGTESPDVGADIGLTGMISGNIGWFNFPVRIHGNAGYWWSRNDGAFYFRNHPLPLPITNPVADNNVVSYSLGLEAGLRRVQLFTEVITEQLMDLRKEISGSENLWRLIPGFRTQLNPNLELTGAISLDLSSNDPKTAFDPKDVYPNAELIVGLTLGSVLSRDRYEHAARTRSAAKRAALAAQAVKPAPVTAAVPAVATTAAMTASPPATVVMPAPAPPGPSPAMSPAPDAAALAAARLRELEERLGRLELANRLDGMDARLRALETPPGAPTTAWTPPATAVEPVRTDSASLSLRERELMLSLDELQFRLNEMLRASQSALAPATAEPAATAPAVPADTTTAAPTGSAAAARPAATALAAVAPTTTSAPEQAYAPSTTTTAAPTPTADKLTLSEPQAAAPVQVSPQAETSPPAEASVLAASAVREQELARQLAAMQEQIDALSRARSPEVAAPTQAAPLTIVQSDRAAVPATEIVTTVPVPATGQPVSAAAPETAAAPKASYQASAVAATSAPPVTGNTPELIEAVSPVAPFFPSVIGEKAILPGIDLSLPNPAADASTQATLGALASQLVADPQAQIMLTVHGSGSDHALALRTTEEKAALLRDFLIASGAGPGQVVALGMGLAEPVADSATLDAGLRDARVEIERIR